MLRRTPTTRHTEIAQDVFLKLYKNNLLTETTDEQPYCDSHHSFLAHKCVEGDF